jgi:hypothetical protein
MVKADRGQKGLRSQIKAIELSKSAIDRIYHFVLSYSPAFPTYEINRLDLGSSSVVLDPFCGTGTTLVAAKKMNVPSLGIEANDFCHFMATTKIHWKVDKNEFENSFKTIIEDVKIEFKELETTAASNQDKFQDILTSYKSRWPSRKLLLKNHISDLPLAKLLHLKEQIVPFNCTPEVKDLLLCCLAAIVTPSSNIKFGPTPGVGRIKNDVDVANLFHNKCLQTLEDLRSIQYSDCSSNITLGDARVKEDYGVKKVDAIITSPPYPAEHEYTRHTRLEMMLLDMVHENSDLQTIKKRMITGSTRNVYKADNEISLVSNHDKIQSIVNDIAEAVEKSKIRPDGSVRNLSGFEKLYAKTVGEYFGGMKKVLKNNLEALKDGGVASYLVGDSRTYKLVHVPTAQILGELGVEVGFERFELELWRNNVSTAHDMDLNEYVLRLYKKG